MTSIRSTRHTLGDRHAIEITFDRRARPATFSAIVSLPAGNKLRTMFSLAFRRKSLKHFLAIAGSTFEWRCDGVLLIHRQESLSQFLIYFSSSPGSLCDVIQL